MQEQLIRHLSNKMETDGLNQGQLAERIGTSASYITSIFSGYRWVARSDRSVIDALALYLGVPTVQIFIWSNYFSLLDLCVEDSLSRRLDSIHEQMMEDPLVRHIVPPKKDWLSCPLNTQISFVKLYEMAARDALLAYANLEMQD
jgi:transcriptional regulator with XRE-family HTH domain